MLFLPQNKKFNNFRSEKKRQILNGSNWWAGSTKGLSGSNQFFDVIKIYFIFALVIVRFLIFRIKIMFCIRDKMLKSFDNFISERNEDNLWRNTSIIINI